MTNNVNISSSLQDLYCAQKEKDCMKLVFCLQGALHLRLNDIEHDIMARDLFRYVADSNIENIHASEDCRVIIYTIELHALDSAFFYCLRNEGDWWGKWNFMQGNPIIHMNERQMLIGSHFHDLIALYQQDDTYDYREETFALIKQIFVYEVLMWIKGQSQYTAPKSIQDKQHARDAIIMQFMKLVERNSRCQRAVNWYAEQLHITPKYLSEVVKRVTGKTAIQVIREHALREIESQLLHTDKSIKEIAYELNFPSLSFFSKYVHENMGAGPVMIRNGKGRKN